MDAGTRQYKPWIGIHLFALLNKIEPIAVELSGGQFLQPVQTLVATSIFSRGRKCNSIPLGSTT